MDWTCTTVRERLSDYLDRALGPAEREAVGGHLAGCPDCDGRLAELRGLVGVLHELDRVGLPEGFEARLARRLEAEARMRPAAAAVPRRAAQGAWWSRWFTFTGWPVRALAGAAVAVVLFLAFSTSGPDRGPAGPAGLPGGSAVPVSATAATPHIDLGKDALVRIWFDAAQDVGNVRFTLELPAGVRMVQDGQVVDSPYLTWEGELKAGRNVIPLHVRGVARGEWTVTAKVERDGAQRARSIGLNVDGA